MTLSWREVLRSSWVIALVLPLCFPAIALAADDPTSNADIAPLLSGSSVLIRVRVDAVDFAAVRDWTHQMLAAAKIEPSEREAMTKESDESLERARQWVGEFSKAGGKTIDVSVNLPFNPMDPGFLAVPVRNGADVQAIENLLTTGSAKGPASKPDNLFEPRVELFGKTLVWGMGTTIATLKQANGKPATARPDLSAALASAGDVPVAVAIAVPAEVKQQLVQQNDAKLPEELGGGPVGPLVSKMDWASLALRLPPLIQSDWLIKCKDGEAARGVSDVVAKALDHLKNGTPGSPPSVQAKALADTFTLKVEGDTVRLSAATDAINKQVPAAIEEAAKERNAAPPSATGPSPGAPGAATGENHAGNGS